MYEQIKIQAEKMIEEFLNKTNLKSGQIVVIGCSTSEVMGEHIGKGSDTLAAKAIFDGIYPLLKQKSIFVAAQCCEHLNRSLVVERECMEKYNLEEVCVVPFATAGGSFATVTYNNITDPVVVENISAHAGIDIGDTLIGMHLKSVAVPVRLSFDTLNKAHIVCAKTRPKLIGGERAHYLEHIR